MFWEGAKHKGRGVERGSSPPGICSGVGAKHKGRGVERGSSPPGICSGAGLSTRGGV